MITKEQFKQTYENNQPNKIIKLVYRFNSTSTKQKDLIPINIIKFILITIFLIGLLSTILNYNQLATITTYTFTTIFIPLFSITLYAVIANNLRIKRICKILNIDTRLYNYLVYITYGT